MTPLRHADPISTLVRQLEQRILSRRQPTATLGTIVLPAPGTKPPKEDGPAPWYVDLHHGDPNKPGQRVLRPAGGKGMADGTPVVCFYIAGGHDIAVIGFSPPEGSSGGGGGGGGETTIVSGAALAALIRAGANPLIHYRYHDADGTVHEGFAHIFDAVMFGPETGSHPSTHDDIVNAAVEYYSSYPEYVFILG